MKKNILKNLNKDEDILNLKTFPFLLSELGLFLLIIFFVILFFFIPQYHSAKLFHSKKSKQRTAAPAQ